MDGIKSTISSEAKETSLATSKVLESFDVKTTKLILLLKVIEQCEVVSNLSHSTEGDLVKIDRVKLELLNEDRLRQFLILRRDALKGFFDLVCEFEEPSGKEKIEFFDLLLERAKKKYAEKFDRFEMTQADQNRLYNFDYSELSALHDIKRVFNNRLMDLFNGKSV